MISFKFGFVEFTRYTPEKNVFCVQMAMNLYDIYTNISGKM